jgi:lysozyme
VHVTDPGRELIKLFEGFSPIIYICPAGYPTIAHGHVVRKGEIFDHPLSKDEGDELLSKDLIPMENWVSKLTFVPLNNNQFNALVSFAYNLGPFAYQRSTLRSMLNRGEYLGAAEQFLKWIYGGGRILNGLVYRRAAERGMFLADLNEEEDDGSDS